MHLQLLPPGHAAFYWTDAMRGPNNAELIKYRLYIPIPYDARYRHVMYMKLVVAQILKLDPFKALNNIDLTYEKHLGLYYICETPNTLRFKMPQKRHWKDRAWVFDPLEFIIHTTKSS